jgi:antitoxin component YwqK of YwqJK toxin-antitoxin module
MNQIHRTALFTLTLTLVLFACSGPKPANIEQPQEPAAAQDLVKQDSVPQETVATVALDTVNVIVRDTLSQEEYNALMAALKPKLNTKQRQRKKADAPTRKGYDYNLLNIEGDEGVIPLKDVFPFYTIGLYGNVESVTETTFTIEEKNGIYFKQKSGECLYELNERGDFTRIIRSEPDKRDIIVLLCKYDNYGNITYYKYDEGKYKDKSEWTAKYIYDDKGKLIAEEKNSGMTIFQYDRNDKLAEELCYDDQDKLISCKRYNRNGKLSEELYYDGKDSLIGCTKYDNKGRIILESPTFALGLPSIGATAKYRYKKKGAYTIQLQSVQLQPSDKERWFPIANYDSQGRRTFYKSHPDNTIPYWGKSTYDNKGNLIYYHVTPNDLEVHDSKDYPTDIRAKYDAYNRLIGLNGIWQWLGDKLNISNKYDAKGNLVLVKYESRRVAIKYDSQGNAVQKIEYQVMENIENEGTKREIWPISITEYKIAYRK